MNFIGYPLSTTGLKQFTKLCFYGYSEAYTFNFNSILFFCYTFTFLFFTQSDFWTKSFVLKRLGHHLITCLFSKCLVLLLQLIHFIQKTAARERIFVYRIFLWEYEHLLKYHIWPYPGMCDGHFNFSHKTFKSFQQRSPNQIYILQSNNFQLFLLKYLQI